MLAISYSQHNTGMNLLYWLSTAAQPSTPSSPTSWSANCLTWDSHTCSWIKDFLTNRPQTMKLGPRLSPTGALRHPLHLRLQTCPHQKHNSEVSWGWSEEEMNLRKYREEPSSFINSVFIIQCRLSWRVHMLTLIFLVPLVRSMQHH